MIIETASAVELGKWALSAIGVLWGGFKGYNWVKDIREKDLASLKQGVSELKASIDSQTNQIVAELKEQRQDFRTFYAPHLQIQPTAARRPRKAPARKK